MVSVVVRVRVRFIVTVAVYVDLPLELLYRSDVKIADWLFLWRKKTRMPLYRYVQFTPPKPHVSLHDPNSLSDYLSNSLIVDLDNRLGPPRPTNPGESFL